MDSASPPTLNAGAYSTDIVLNETCLPYESQLPAIEAKALSLASFGWVGMIRGSILLPQIGPEMSPPMVSRCLLSARNEGQLTHDRPPTVALVMRNPFGTE